MRRKLDRQILDAMSRNPGNWRGPFYYNRSDPRLRVPKQNPMMGYTYNFGNPYSYAIVSLIVVFVILAIIF